MKRFKHILLLLLATMVVSCDATIHEYPGIVETPVVIVPVTLTLKFDTDMPLYQSITHTRAELTDGDFDVRYIINVYTASAYRQVNGNLVGSYVFSKDDISKLDYSVQLQLEQGVYDFVVWADYVDAETTTDKYYDTSSFSTISVIGELSGSNDYRDAFVGYGKCDLSADPQPYTYTIPMGRPMAKYRFISNDLDSFVSRMLALKKQQQEENRSEDDDTKGDTKVEIDLEDYYVEFHYVEYVNTSFNALMDISAAPSYNISFRSTINKINEREAEIGFDYIFVGDDTKVWVALNIYEKDGTKVGGVDKLLVPLSRSKLTEVRGSFLTLKEEGGVGIDPDFEDEFTITIK